MPLNIIYQDDSLIAINKPHGLLVHKSPIAADVKDFALQMLRDQVNRRVYPVHRLDRKTSGVLLFTFKQDDMVHLNNQFMAGRVVKKYLAIVRGHTEGNGTIDYPLTNDAGKTQDAVTHFTTLAKTEIPYALEKHPTQRYSLIEANPETGRMHQLRKHFAHIFHPIIGDRPHGCNKQNRFFKETFQMESMMLHASELQCKHPITEQLITIKAPLSDEFLRMIDVLGLEY